jgi:lysophospholipase L1-like esterase
MKQLSIILLCTFLIAGLKAQPKDTLVLKMDSAQYQKAEEGFLLRQQQEERMKDWAKFSRYEASNKLETAPPKVVFMGNSITEGWVRDHPDFFNTNGFVGRGISGQTSAEMLVRFRSDVIMLKPKAVVINAGTNDIAHNNGTITLEHILQNIISMCELAKMNHIKPILSSVLPANHFWWNETLKPARDIVTLNGMIRQYALKNKITYVDYYSLLVDKNGGLDQKYSGDGVHPNLTGYGVMESIILKGLK